MQAMEKLHNSGFISTKKINELRELSQSGELDRRINSLKNNNDYTVRPKQTYGFNFDQTTKNRMKRARKSKKVYV